MRLFQANEVASDVAAKALFCEPFKGPFIGLLVLDDGDIIRGVVIIDDYNRANAELTAAGRGCWTPTVVRELARYLFVTLGLRRVTAHCRQNNAAAIKALERIGFKRECVCRDWFSDSAAVQFRLLRKECKVVKL